MWTAQRHGWRSAPAACKNHQRCRATTSGQSAPTTLSPRQRKLAAKRKQKQQQRLVLDNQPPSNGSSNSSSSSKHKQQYQKQPVQQHAQTVLSPCISIKQQQQLKGTQVAPEQQQQQHGLPASLTSLAAIINQQQQQQLAMHEQVTEDIQSLSADQLSQLALLWAQESRNMLFSDLEAVQPLLTCYVTAAQQHLQQGAFDRQQLADVAWGLAHFDGLQWRCQQQQQQQLCPSELQQQQQQQSSRLHLHWCGPFQAALRVPFLVLPNLLPNLQITDFLTEVTLQRDVIYLTDDKGEIKAVPEARLTGWQSDIGATFKYSGKEMVPETRLTPSVAQVRDVLAAAAGVHYDSVLINYYADGKCGMRYHVDPLYGKWTTNSAVVSLGATRQFVFRRIDDHNIRWAYNVSTGDVVVMFDDCQDILQHAVKVEATPDAAGPRISLVYKERIRLEDGTWA